MKNYILLLFVTALFQVNAQISPSNPVVDAKIIYGDEVYLQENAITVPDGKFWVIAENSGYFRVSPPNFSNAVAIVPGDVIPAGYKIHFAYVNAGNQGSFKFSALEYNYNTDEALGFNDVEPIKDRIKLFPNPTTNQLALNSDKVYQIEVFDLTGNKVMELKGNTISVEHLSSATYIVNAIDLETKESLSYKVVKK